MQVHALDINDFCEDTYHLIGIHTTLEDYKLAYLLNSTLKTTFKRASYTIETTKYASFPVFYHYDKKYEFDWYLLANTVKYQQEKNLANSLFETETKAYLLPDRKKVDYFLKIVGNADHGFLKKNINTLNKIPQIVTSYSIDTNTLKSKDYLIF